MMIPHMPVQVAWYLVEAGYSEIFQLRGRAAESLLEEIKKHELFLEEQSVLPALRLAIYFAENSPNLDRSLLTLQAWKK